MSSLLQYSPADILRRLMVDAGLGSLPESNGTWPISAGQELPEPDNTLTTYDTTGRIDGVIQTDGEIQEHYGVQIRLRCGLQQSGWTKLSAVRAYLSEQVQNTYVVIDTIVYRVWCVTNIGSILSIGKDAQNTRRRLYTLNVTIVVTEDASEADLLVTEENEYLVTEDGIPIVWQ